MLRKFSLRCSERETTWSAEASDACGHSPGALGSVGIICTNMPLKAKPVSICMTGSYGERDRRGAPTGDFRPRQKPFQSYMHTNTVANSGRVGSCRYHRISSCRTRQKRRHTQKPKAPAMLHSGKLECLCELGNGWLWGPGSKQA